MAKKAIYREYRPQTFDDVYGQSHITEILKSQVQSGNIAHAYLFSGTRGTGKTSCAKIFARAINCLNLKEGSPCNECANCKMSLNEETMDIVEMDAASNRRIDDIRQLRDVVVYPPANLKYRVYIIDEAHMITNEGFNALLKIMEEPPKHLVFILATTELEKIPATILSRCQRYEFRRIEITDIKSNIQKILKDLSIKMKDDAADLIALKADGSMRDALSSLDQVLSISKEEYDLRDVENVLGIAEQDDLIKILERLSAKDYNGTLNSFEFAAEGKGIESTFEELIEYLQSLMMVQVKMESYMDISPEEADKLKSLTELWPLDKIMTTIDILVHYNNLLKNSEQPHVIVQLALYKACVLEMETSLIDQIQTLKRKVQQFEEEGAAVQTQSPKTAPAAPKEQTHRESSKENKPQQKGVPKASTPEEEIEPETAKETAVQETESVQTQELRMPDEEFNPLWTTFQEEVKNKETGSLLGNYLSFVEDRFEYNEQVYIIFPDDNAFFIQRLQAGKNYEDLQSSFEEAFGSKKMRLLTRSEYEKLNRKTKNIDHTELIKKIFGEDIEIID